MKEKLRTIICICFFLFICLNLVLCQEFKAKVYKQVCETGGSRIEVEVRKDGVLLDSLGREYYNYPNMVNLPDSIRLKIVEDLLSFASDTSVCCNPILFYVNPYYPGCSCDYKSSNKFSIQIEALFLINRVAYYSFTSRIGCYPVLYDKETKQEINRNSWLINIMVEHYNDWYRLYKETGKRPPYDFLNEGRITWIR